MERTHRSQDSEAPHEERPATAEPATEERPTTGNPLFDEPATVETCQADYKSGADVRAAFAKQQAK